MDIIFLLFLLFLLFIVKIHTFYYLCLHMIRKLSFVKFFYDMNHCILTIFIYSLLLIKYFLIITLMTANILRSKSLS
jgi:hypothetical protein